ncbi:hypothetical protein [Vibrio mediterranei]|uniref:hypothetical protein n=1 Tax=Vibrio mediterranei TaxID=689 RepID=UPI00148BF25B|nr:hypothetical protein [Vibrio mediterranei]NOI23989.1 hypothetical protein [Vibrio mediterranei]
MTSNLNGYEIPILILTFNRLDTTLALISALSEVKPETIYFSSDGPRNDTESMTISNIREKVLDAIDWDCNIVEIFHAQNMGCQSCVDYAIKYMFQREDSGIILEDDCIPNKAFFEYMSYALETFEHDLTISSVSGRNHLVKNPIASAVTSNRFYCWGWGTWRNRIDGLKIDDVVTQWGLKKLLSTRYGSFRDALFVTMMSGLLKTKQVDSWAYAYDLYFRDKNLRCLVPKVNYINNIGFDGTHSDSWNIDPMGQSDDFIRDDYENIIDGHEYNSLVYRQEYASAVKQMLVSVASWVPGIRKLKKRLGGKLG